MPELPTLWPLALGGLAVSALLAVITWVASLVQRDVSLVDRTWSLMICGASLAYAWQVDWQATRALCVLVLLLAWAVRLAVHITTRNWGHGEDRRYQAIRARNQPNFALKSLVYVFALQTVLAWVVSAPTLAAFTGRREMGVLDVVGIGVAIVGFLFEAVGDLQLTLFKRNPGNRGHVMDTGLWRYTRHPNYFGEACFWWGVWLVAVGGGGVAALWTIVSPLLMTVLLMKVSGVAMLEKDIGQRRPAYRDYIARTNAFFPGPPRKELP